MDWPRTLPIPLAAGYAYNDGFEVIRPDNKLGFAPSVRRGQINKPLQVSASLRLTFDQFAVFDWLVTRKLRNGVIWIILPLTFDDGVVNVQSRIAGVNASTDGDHWNATLTLEVSSYGHTATLA